MSVKPLVLWPDQRLNEKCLPVKTFGEGKAAIGDDLFDTMKYHKGAGLAAPQIGRMLRVVCVSLSGGALIMCNPSIISHGKDVEVSREGCLSLPHVFRNVERYRVIDVEWFSPSHGYRSQRTFKGLDARIIQHEIDHLDGKLINQITNN